MYAKRLGESGALGRRMPCGWLPPPFTNSLAHRPPFLQPFYGKELALVICGYIRPEANFTSLQVRAGAGGGDGRGGIVTALAAVATPLFQLIWRCGVAVGHSCSQGVWQLAKAQLADLRTWSCGSGVGPSF